MNSYEAIYRAQWVNAMTELCPIYGLLPNEGATIAVLCLD